MEYRQACDAECTRLIFQLDPDAPWLDKFNDRLTGEGNGGAKIQRFRAAVGVRHGNRFFLPTPKNWPASCSKPSSPRLAKTRLVFFGSKGRAGVFYGHRGLNRTTSLGVTTGPDAEV
jgi:hypothetical protein